MLAVLQTCNIPYIFHYPHLPYTLWVKVSLSRPMFSSWCLNEFQHWSACGFCVQSFYFLIHTYIYIYRQACVYTFERLCWLPGGLSVPLSKWNLAVVEKCLDFCNLLIFAFLFFFFYSCNYCRADFYLGNKKSTTVSHSIELTVTPACKHQ